MDERRQEEVLAEYLRLEDAFLNLTSFIPLHPDLEDSRYAVASPRTAEFGLDCGTWIETLFRELLADRRWDDVPEIQEAREASRQTIELYRRAFGDMFVKGGGYQLKWFDPTSTTEIRPFEEWAEGKSPEWFSVYSGLKHDRFELASRFNMGHALRAFVALTILVNHWLPADYRGLRQIKRPPSRVLRGI